MIIVAILFLLFSLVSLARVIIAEKEENDCAKSICNEDKN